MPNYEYACADCGPFKAWRSMAQSDQPAPCPDCAVPSPRLMSTPNLGAASVGTPAPAAAGSSMRIHSGGCACCAPRSATRIAAPA